MSEKRFIPNFDVSIYDRQTDEHISTSVKGLKEITKRMNKQQSEIEELQITIKLYEVDIIEKDKQIKQLQKQLDFIQNAISDAIQHQKTELGQKALKEIIFDYNEFLLGHKGVE